MFRTAVEPTSAAVARLLRRWTAPRCFVCGVARAAGVCEGCSNDFFGRECARCRLCAARVPASGAELCAACLREPPSFDGTHALGDYAAPLDGLVIALKFGHRLAIARVLGQQLAERLRGVVAPGTLIVPVPLAFERHAERGFNQALEIARVLARRLALPLRPEVVLRIRHGAAQESLARDARRRNVRGAFAVRADMAGRDLLVVDDVMTSGATLAEIARVLKAAQAARVVNAVLARTA